MPDAPAPPADAPADADAPTPTDDDDAPLGPEGEKALGVWKDRAKEAEKQARQAAAQLEQLKKQSMTDAEKAVAKAKEEGKAEALATANTRLLKAEVRAAAAGKLADPSLAVKLLDLDQFAVGDDGDVDPKALGKAIDQLVKDYPALAKTPAGAGVGDGGPRSPAKGFDMNAEIRRRMGRS